MAPRFLPSFTRRLNHARGRFPGPASRACPLACTVAVQARVALAARAHPSRGSEVAGHYVRFEARAHGESLETAARNAQTRSLSVLLLALSAVSSFRPLVFFNTTLSTHTTLTRRASEASASRPKKCRFRMWACGSRAIFSRLRRAPCGPSPSEARNFTCDHRPPKGMAFCSGSFCFWSRTNTTHTSLFYQARTWCRNRRERESEAVFSSVYFAPTPTRNRSFRTIGCGPCRPHEFDAHQGSGQGDVKGW